ncbi:MAG: RNB domain-containing ribonuclease, partial [Firmicutes bacterium]|nr:RNB domain-containing ribonuclease [Bacillota bacterium]
MEAVDKKRINDLFLGILKTHNIAECFENDVINEAKKVNKEPTATELKRRLDLTKELIVTIDPDDAKDLDDAVDIKINKDGTYTLGVHIADVSHYVQESGHLDNEAFRRGTSVYFPGKVYPMLPKELSNGICSLHPNVPRLTLSAYMTIDTSGNILEYSFYESVINSRFRLSYNTAQDILDGKITSLENTTVADFKKLELALRQMGALCLILEKVRTSRGEIAFNIPEPKIILDEHGIIKDVIAYPHWLSHRIIESFMICANEVVAKHFCDNKIP